jgi:hypothetical protein
MAPKKKQPKHKAGRPKGSVVPIERDRRKYAIAVFWAFHELGCGRFEATRLTLLVTEGGAISLRDIEGFLVSVSAEIPLPRPDPNEPDQGIRRFAAKAVRARPSPWLINSAAFVQGLITFIANGNTTGACLTLDGLLALGWEPVIVGLAERIETALRSNIPPAELEQLSPAARRLLARLRATGPKTPTGS